MSYNFSMGAVVDRTHTGKFEVFCNRCGVSIGIMTGKTLLEACFNTIGRGGVLCPKCRENTCHFCGVGQQADFRHCVVRTKDKGDLRICFNCLGDMPEEVEDFEVIEVPF